MLRNNHYNTKQKDIILKTIKNQKNSFTIKDIYNKTKNQVGLTTIYRLIPKLIENNILNKYIDKDNITYYQYLKECSEKNHFYLKCDKCGNLVHIDCNCINDISKHIIKEHKFKPNNNNIIINGLCEKCLKNNKNLN